MTFHILTLFPEMIAACLGTSIIGRAEQKGIISVDPVNIRDYTIDSHRKTDDYPYGGGVGMVMQAQPVYDAWSAVTDGGKKQMRCIYLTPQGRIFNQSMAKEMAAEEEVILLCGHYEGVDERVLDAIVTDQISAGDYVLTGGELPAMMMVDAIARMVPGVLSNRESAETESLEDGLLEYPQYSRPEVWNGQPVPPVLLCGDHKKVEMWRREQALLRTVKNRPDLLEDADLDYEDIRKLLAISSGIC